MKVEKIIQQLKENKSVSEIAKNEKINRHSVSLVKQTLELLEEKHKKELEQIKKELDEKEKIKQKCIEAYNKLLEQNKKLSSKLQQESFIECISKYQYHFLAMFIIYSVIMLVAIALIKKFFGG